MIAPLFLEDSAMILRSDSWRPLGHLQGNTNTKQQRHGFVGREPSQVFGYLGPPLSRGPQDHINIRTLHSGSKAQNEGDARNHGL